MTETATQTAPKKTRTKRAAVAQDVRAFFVVHPDLIPEGCENGVKMGKQGRLPRAAVEVFNKRNRSLEYKEGNEETIPLPVPGKDSRGRNITRKIAVPKSEVRKLAGAEGKRGYLSKAQITAAGERYAEQIASN